MLMVAATLNCFVALMLFLMAAKYVFGPVPADYHAAILDAEGAIPSENTLLILRALYLVFSGALVALGIIIVVLSVGPVLRDEFWAQVLIVTSGTLFSAVATIVPLTVEQTTNIRTPWRIAMAGGAILSIAFMLALVG